MYLGKHKDEQEILAEEQVNRGYDLLQELINFHYRAVHNVVLVIGTGTFALSISFIGYIRETPEHPELLIASWVLLALTLVLKTSSHMLGSKIAEDAQSLLVEYRDAGYFSSIPNFDPLNPTNRKIDDLRTRREWIDCLTLIALALAIIFLIIFASVNLIK